MASWLLACPGQETKHALCRVFRYFHSWIPTSNLLAVPAGKHRWFHQVDFCYRPKTWKWMDHHLLCILGRCIPHARIRPLLHRSHAKHQFNVFIMPLDKLEELLLWHSTVAPVIETGRYFGCWYHQNHLHKHIDSSCILVLASSSVPPMVHSYLSFPFGNKWITPRGHCTNVIHYGTRKLLEA